MKPRALQVWRKRTKVLISLVSILSQFADSRGVSGIEA